MSKPIPPDQRLRRVARRSGLSVVALGALVLLGWFFGIEPLKRVLPGFVSMKPNTALLMVLSGAALLLLGSPVKQRFLLAGATGAAVAGFAGFLIADLLVGVPWDIHGWLVPSGEAAGLPTEGRLAPSTALSFLAVGLSLLLYTSTRTRPIRVARGLTLIPASVGLVALIGYFYSIQGLYHPIPSTTAMAIHTALGLVVLAVGAFAAHPQAGLGDILVSPTTGARLFRFAFPWAALALILLGWFRLVAEHLGLIDPQQGTAAFVLGAIAVIGVLLWHHAREANESQMKEEEAQRKREEFVAMLAHELRNPLAAITNCSELLAHLDLDERGRRSQETIRRQSRHMARLVDGLLDLSRLTRGRIELHRQEVDLEALLNRLLDEEARALVAEKKQEIMAEIDDSLTVEGDPVRLSQVFWNLLSNAARFAPPGSRIRIVGSRNGSSDVVVSVSDEGPGIAAENRERIFEPFFQTDQSLARSEGGLGIGLTLVRQIVELHGGEVTVEDREPGGSTFRVRLPRRSRWSGYESGIWG